MKKEKKKRGMGVFGLAVLIALVALLASLYMQRGKKTIAPPQWMWGEWEDVDNGVKLEVSATDIIVDGASNGELLRRREISFTQSTKSSSYRMVVDFDNGQRFEEIFYRGDGNNMRSVYREINFDEDHTYVRVGGRGAVAGRAGPDAGKRRVIDVLDKIRDAVRGIFRLLNK